MARPVFSARSCNFPDSHVGDCDCAWTAPLLALVPPAFRAFVERKYTAISNRSERNNWLRELVNSSHAAKFTPALFEWHSDPIEGAIPKRTKFIDLSIHMGQLVESSDSDIKDLAKELAGREEIWIYRDAPEALHHPRLEPRLRRYLRKAARQKKEMWALTLGLVGGHIGGNRAVSNMTLDHRQQQLEAQQEWASRTTITIADGKEIELTKIMAQNKKNRLAEIITVTKGIEQQAKSDGLQAVFITLTAHPRFHPNPAKGQKSWDGSTPEAGKKWLMRQWVRTRARFAKRGIQVVGVRATEAHADGCPHLHLMIWIRPEKINEVEREFRKSKGWNTEKGAKFVIIETGEGKASASSYVLKYIMKTLNNSADSADRDDAWRATWSVRAIQFFGIPSFDLWRTLRKSRPEDILDADPRIAAARYAAIGGRYAAFLELAGGLNMKKSDRPLRTETEKNETATVKKIFSFETLAIVIARIKSTLTTTQKQKVTVIQNYPSNCKTKTQKPSQAAFPPPATAPPHLNFVFA